LIALVTVGAILAAAWMSSTRRGWAERRETWTAWSFLAPSALHLAVFTLGPLLFTVWVSLHNWDLLSAEKPFVGLDNYRDMFADPLFWNALRNTAVYALYVPVTMALSLCAAVLLNRPMRGVRLIRAMVFLPTVVSFAAIAIVWQWMFNADYGLLNFAFRSIGLDPIDWLGNPATALVAVMIVSAWIQLGYQMIIYLAGLQGIPATLYEAATLDGASRWQRFVRITEPLLRPTSVYLFVTGVIWSFQVFTLVYVMTEGGPVHATDVLVYRIYQNAWEFRRMGYASAMSWFLFALLLVLTVAQWRVLNRRVDHAT
jgi:ABC-type sugar transport system permease subunit